MGSKTAQSNSAPPGRTMMITPPKPINTAIQRFGATCSRNIQTDNSVMNRGAVKYNATVVAIGRAASAR